jgi:hypothetical protein
LILSLLFLVLAGSEAVASEVEASGSIEQDLRYRIDDLPAGPWYAPVGVSQGFSRAETVLSGQARVRGSRLSGLADLSLVADGFSQPIDGLEQASERGRVAPVSVEVNDLYVDLWDVRPGLDIRVGHQVVQWGVGDQFNPTNNLNPDDLEDPLRFGKQLPNLMVRADHAIGPSWTLSGVWVPLFRPSLLPKTAQIGASAIDRFPMTEEALRWKLYAEQALARDWEILGYPTVVSSTNPVQPASSLSNSQFEFRLGGSVGMTDVALNYYRGRSDIPQPGANFTSMDATPQCHPDDPDDCIKGLLRTDVSLVYPRIQVAGFNAAGELSPLGFLGVKRRLGWRLEAALIVPEQTVIELENARLDLGGISQAAGEYDYQLGGERPTVIEARPFAKWTIGLDATLSKQVYVNAQWVHGLPDEMGAGDFLSEGWTVRAGGVDSAIEQTIDCAVVYKSGRRCATETLRYRIGDYGVLGADITISQTLLRLFGMVDLTGYRTTHWSEGKQRRKAVDHSAFSVEGFSAVIYPELSQNMGDGLTLSAGALLMVGEPHTKFGDPAAGGDLLFGRGSYRF